MKLLVGEYLEDAAGMNATEVYFGLFAVVDLVEEVEEVEVVSLVGTTSGAELVVVIDESLTISEVLDEVVDVKSVSNVMIVNGSCLSSTPPVYTIAIENSVLISG